jgi:nucleoside-diphosphate-sugar epimerase
VKRVLVTGANGFIGRHCLKFLLEADYEVHATSSRLVSSSDSPAAWHSVDLLDPKAVAATMDEVSPTHLLHLAWYTAPGAYWNSSENFRWVQASVALLSAFAAAGGKRLLTAGTSAEYDWTYGYCTEYLTPLNPGTVYGKCKHALEILTEAFCGQNGLSSSWGRIFFTFGPFEHPGRLVPSVIGAILRGEPVACTHGTQLRDFLHVEDLASGLVAVLDCDATGPVNVASGIPVSVRDVISTISQILESDAQINWGAIPLADSEPDLLVGNNKRLRQEVGWQEQYDLQTRLEQAVLWWKTRLAKKDT